jgi:aconitate hydratase
MGTIVACPWCFALLLENVLRNTAGAERDAAVAALFDWLGTGRSEAEIAFQPGPRADARHHQHAGAGRHRRHARRAGRGRRRPDALNPRLPVDVSVDHSLAVEAFARAGCGHG